MLKTSLVLCLMAIFLGVISLAYAQDGPTPGTCSSILLVADQSGMAQAHELLFNMADPEAVIRYCAGQGWSREFITEIQAYGATIDVEHGDDALGGLATGSAGELRVGMLDMVIVTDTTNSMEDDIDQAKARALDIIAQVAASGMDWRIALVTYRDYPDGTHAELDDYQARLELGFSTDSGQVYQAINAIWVQGGADESESVYSGLMLAMSLPFRHGAQKVIVLMGDAPPHDPEPGTGYTQRDVLTTAFNLDPVNIYPILIDNSSDVYDSFAALSDGSSGRMFSTADSTELVPVLLSTIETATGDTHLTIGGRARVYTTAGDTLNVRAGTSTSQDVLERMPKDSILQIIGGPVFEYPYIWWQVRTPSGVVGWSVEAADGIVTLVNIPAPRRLASGESIVFMVQSNTSANFPGIMIQAGQTITITYLSGEWRAGALPTWPYHGPAGDPQTPSKGTFPLQNAAIMSLIVGVGGQAPVYVGNQITLRTAIEGELWLGANDDYYSDNVGALEVRITAND